MIRVLGIIPARGGSKGVPRKNIKLLCGKPLLAYTVESSQQAKRLTRTVLSTEDKEMAEVGRALGIDVPFLRPLELAEDDTPSFDVVLHVVKELESRGEYYDAVCLLQPTNPLRRSEDIDGCIECLETSGADSVVTILPVPDTYNPKWVYWRTPEGKLELSSGDGEPVSRRQDLPEAFHREGSAYLTRRDVLFEYMNLYGANIRGYCVDRENSINIDSLEDWKMAEMMINQRSAKASNEFVTI